MGIRITILKELFCFLFPHFLFYSTLSIALASLVAAELGNGSKKTLLEKSCFCRQCQKPPGSGNTTRKLVSTRLPD